MLIFISWRCPSVRYSWLSFLHWAIPSALLSPPSIALGCILSPFKISKSTWKGVFWLSTNISKGQSKQLSIASDAMIEFNASFWRWKNTSTWLCRMYFNSISLLFQLEPGSPVEIMNALEHVRPGNGFIPNFPLFAKSDVNGANRLPLYDWATVNP